jgi:Mechanosensitive ion channel
METFKLWTESAETMTGLPRNVLLATLVFGVGWLLAFVARALATRFVRDVARLMSGRGDRSGGNRFEETVARHRIHILVGRGAFWAVLFLSLMTATQLLGFPVVTTWLIRLVAYLPRILLGVAIVFAGVVAGSVARSTVSRAMPASDIVDPQGLGGIIQGIVVGFAILVAVQQLGIDVAFITTVVTIALVGFFAAGALAFGFGGRATVANILASHYVRELYEIGQTIRVGELEGRIVRMTPTAVILSTPEGETAVPSQIFVEASSTRIADGGRL